MNITIHNRRVTQQQGFTLIEVLLAMVIGLILTTALVQITDSFRNSTTLERSQVQIQDTGHFAMYYLSRAIRHNRFFGPRPPEGWVDDESGINVAANFNNVSSSVISDFQFRAFEVDSTGSFSPSPSLDDMKALENADIVKPNTDVISIIYVDPASDSLDADLSTLSSNVVVSGSPTVTFNTGDLVFISDKTTYDIFRITNDPADTDPPELAHGSSQNSRDTLNHIYKSSDTTVHHFRGDTYFIADTGRTNRTSGATVYSLYRLALDESPSTAVEVIEGVEHMELLYGIKQNSDAIQYVSASNAAFDPDRVISVKVAILVESGEPALSNNDTNDYQLLDVTVGPNGTIDHESNTHMRRVFTTAINLKNAPSYLYDN